MFRKLKSVKDLNLTGLKLQQIKRNQIPMLVIDDDKFEYQNILQNHDFSIKHIEDIDAIDFVHNYEIILCDINGVGKKFGSKFDGAHIISEIRKKYPFKYIIAYTGHTHDPSYTKHLRKADTVINKDISSDEWIEELDNAIKQTVNPINKWSRIRDFLIAHEIEIQTVAKLEDEYVRIILSGDDISNFPKKKTMNKLPDEVKDILMSFTTSIIFKLIFSI